LGLRGGRIVNEDIRPFELFNDPAAAVVTALVHVNRPGEEELPAHKLPILTARAAFGTAIVNERYIAAERLGQHLAEGLPFLPLAGQLRHRQAVQELQSRPAELLQAAFDRPDNHQVILDESHSLGLAAKLAGFVPLTYAAGVIAAAVGLFDLDPYSVGIHLFGSFRSSVSGMMVRAFLASCCSFEAFTLRG
jgi:hypothetical protein